MKRIVPLLILTAFACLAGAPAGPPARAPAI
jgi:hypothetical protein